MFLKMAELPDICTTEEVAKQFKKSKKTVQNWLAAKNVIDGSAYIGKDRWNMKKLGRISQVHLPYSRSLSIVAAKQGGS